MVDFSEIKTSAGNLLKNKIFLIGVGVCAVVIITVIIVAASSGGEEEKTNPPDQPTPSTPFEAYLQAKKYLYVWSYANTENFLKFVTDHHFSRVYLFVGSLESTYTKFLKGVFHKGGDSDSKELVKKLIDKGIEVEVTIYLNDDPNNFENVEKMTDIAKAMAEMRKTLKFKALHFDVEPSNKENYEKLLHMYEDCRQYLPVSAILKPGWLSLSMSDLESSFTSSDYFKKFKNCETFVDALMMVTDYSDLMAYSSKYETVNKFLSKYDAIRKRHSTHVGKPVLELDADAGNDSTYTRYKEDHDTFFNFTVNVSKAYDGITIHHYKEWYKDLYCEKPTEDSTYFFGKPKEC